MQWLREERFGGAIVCLETEEEDRQCVDCRYSTEEDQKLEKESMTCTCQCWSKPAGVEEEHSYFRVVKVTRSNSQEEHLRIPAEKDAKLQAGEEEHLNVKPGEEEKP